ncbi:MAG: hypothetical protein RMJ84_05155 [Sandaracinaceae bacterium]|nr:hypothetical protein [Sandaracinaceae bacterium]
MKKLRFLVYFYLSGWVWGGGVSKAQLDLSQPVVQRAPARLFIVHDAKGHEDVMISVQGREEVCRTPCDVLVPPGEVKIKARHASRRFQVGSGLSYDVEVDLGWEHIETYVLGWVYMVGGFVMANLIVPGIGRLLGYCTSFLIFDWAVPRCRGIDLGWTVVSASWAFVSLFGAIVALIGVLDVAGGEVRVKPRNEEQKITRRSPSLRLEPQPVEGGGMGMLAITF